MSALTGLPNSALDRILKYVDVRDLPAVLSTCQRILSLGRHYTVRLPPAVNEARSFAESIIDLPNELLLAIFAECGAKSLYAILTCCRRFNQIRRFIIPHVLRTSFTTQNALTEGLKNIQRWFDDEDTEFFRAAHWFRAAGCKDTRPILCAVVMDKREQCIKAGDTIVDVNDLDDDVLEKLMETSPFNDELEMDEDDVPLMIVTAVKRAENDYDSEIIIDFGLSIYNPCEEVIIVKTGDGRSLSSAIWNDNKASFCDVCNSYCKREDVHWYTSVELRDVLEPTLESMPQSACVRCREEHPEIPEPSEENNGNCTLM